MSKSITMKPDTDLLAALDDFDMNDPDTEMLEALVTSPNPDCPFSCCFEAPLDRRMILTWTPRPQKANKCTQGDPGERQGILAGCGYLCTLARAEYVRWPALP